MKPLVALDGTSYEIDIGKRNAAKLRSVLQDYTAHARAVRHGEYGCGLQLSRSYRGPNPRHNVACAHDALDGYVRSGGADSGALPDRMTTRGTPRVLCILLRPLRRSFLAFLAVLAVLAQARIALPDCCLD